jgi:hypothetical protein
MGDVLIPDLLVNKEKIHPRVSRAAEGVGLEAGPSNHKC